MVDLHVTMTTRWVSSLNDLDNGDHFALRIDELPAHVHICSKHPHCPFLLKTNLNVTAASVISSYDIFL